MVEKPTLNNFSIEKTALINPKFIFYHSEKEEN